MYVFGPGLSQLVGYYDLGRWTSLFEKNTPNIIGIYCSLGKSMWYNGLLRLTMAYYSIIYN